MLLAALTCSACNGAKTEPAKAAAPESDIVTLTAEQAKHAALVTSVVEAREASNTLQLPGTLAVDPRRLWRVSPAVDGVVEEVGAVAHDVVQKWQLLARLRSSALGEVQVAWLDARASLRLATADHDRSILLRKEGIVSESQLLRVDTELQRAKGAVAQAERKLTLSGMSEKQIEALEGPDRRLGEMTLTTPGAGVVLAANVSRGQALTAGAEAFQVADLSTLWVSIQIPVASLTQLVPGAKAKVLVAGGPRPSWDGELGSLGGQVDAAAQTVEGRISVTNEGGFLRPGMYAEVEVVGAAVKAMMAPTAALFTVGNQAYVFQKVKDATFRAVPVIASAPVGEWTPVTGVDAGAEVVTTGAAELKSHWLYTRGE